MSSRRARGSARGSTRGQRGATRGSGRGQVHEMNTATATNPATTLSGDPTTAVNTRSNRGRPQPTASSGSKSLNSVGKGKTNASVKPRTVPEDIVRGRYCLFCYQERKSRKHHSVPTAVEIQDLESRLLDLQRELHGSVPQDTPHVEYNGTVPNPALQQPRGHEYNTLLWQLERGKELRKKGFGVSFDLWIDHLTLAEVINENWSYDAIRSRIPEEWIEDTEAPTFLVDKRPRFPPGTQQRGDIEAEVAALDEEETLDAMDDNEQNAEADIYRIRNISPIPMLEDEEDEDEEDDDDKPIGENLGLEAAHAAIQRLRNKIIRQTIKMWRDNAKPYTDRDSKLQMRDYIKDIHDITESSSNHTPSTEVYRAITNIAFSMESAHRLWKQRGLTDEGYSKLTRDGFQQLASLRSTLEEAGVENLPASTQLPPSYQPRQQKPIQPFVIDRWMDENDGDLHRPYVYTPDRPLGPMISENARGPRFSGGEGLGGFAQDTSDSSQVKMSREELMGLNMQLDQLVDD